MAQAASQMIAVRNLSVVNAVTENIYVLYAGTHAMNKWATDLYRRRVRGEYNLTSPTLELKGRCHCSSRLSDTIFYTSGANHWESKALLGSFVKRIARARKCDGKEHSAWEATEQRGKSSNVFAEQQFAYVPRCKAVF